MREYEYQILEFYEVDNQTLEEARLLMQECLEIHSKMGFELCGSVQFMGGCYAGYIATVRKVKELKYIL